MDCVLTLREGACVRRESIWAHILLVLRMEGKIGIGEGESRRGYDSSLWRGRKMALLQSSSLSGLTRQSGRLPRGGWSHTFVDGVGALRGSSGQARGRRGGGWGSFRRLRVSLAQRTPHPPLRGTFSLKGRRGDGTGAVARSLSVVFILSVVIVGLDPTIQKVASRGAGATRSWRAWGRCVGPRVKPEDDEGEG
jgi:hypothetical protein